MIDRIKGWVSGVIVRWLEGSGLLDDAVNRAISDVFASESFLSKVSSRVVINVGENDIIVIPSGTPQEDLESLVGVIGDRVLGIAAVDSVSVVRFV